MACSIDNLVEYDYNNLKLINFLQHVPGEISSEMKIFITPEKIYGYNSEICNENLHILLNMISRTPMSELEIYLSSIKSNNQSNYITFNKCCAAIKEYLTLRPNLLEEYPEFLV